MNKLLPLVSLGLFLFAKDCKANDLKEIIYKHEIGINKTENIKDSYSKKIQHNKKIKYNGFIKKVKYTEYKTKENEIFYIMKIEDEISEEYVIDLDGNKKIEMGIDKIYSKSKEPLETELRELGSDSLAFLFYGLTNREYSTILNKIQK